jgi:glycine cleavage system H protein
MSIPADLRYADTHEWARVDSDGCVIVGITYHAQELLGDLVFVENPAIGRKLRKGEACGVVESVKAASDICAGFQKWSRSTVAAPRKINLAHIRLDVQEAKPDQTQGCRHCSIPMLIETGRVESLNDTFRWRLR